MAVSEALRHLQLTKTCQGAVLEEELKDGQNPKIKGSVMLALADSKEEVLKALQEDIYYKSGIWDWEKVQIHPVCVEVYRSCFADTVKVQNCIQATAVNQSRYTAESSYSH